MSVYNGEQYLKEAIESILNQSFKNFEFIIINDGSTDETKHFIKSYNDIRIVYLENEKNIGLTKSLNLGIKKAKGEYIARMDADDISFCTRLQKQMNLLEIKPELDICGTFYTILPNGIKRFLPVTNSDIKLSIFNGINPIAHPTVMFRKSSLYKFNLFYNENIQYGQDYELWTRALPNFTFENIPEQLLLYRQHEKQITHEKQFLQKKNVEIGCLNVVNYLIDDTEKIQISYHLKLIYNASVDNHELKMIHKWVKLLIIKNNEKQLFDECDFSKYLNRKYLYLCKKFYNKNGFFTKMLFQLYFKFAFRFRNLL